MAGDWAMVMCGDQRVPMLTDAPKTGVCAYYALNHGIGRTQFSAA